MSGKGAVNGSAVLWLVVDGDELVDTFEVEANARRFAVGDYFDVVPVKVSWSTNVKQQGDGS